MTELKAFFPNIRPYAPGVADATAFVAIRQAAIDFCERSRIWNWGDEFSITADDCEGLLSPDGSVIHAIESVFVNGVPLRKVTPHKLDELVPYWRNGNTKPTGQPRFVTQTEPNTMVLAPFGSGTCKVNVVIKPSQDCDELPDLLANQQRETIAWGALARILLIPNQSFTNNELGAYFDGKFQAKLDGKKDAGIAGQQRGPTRTKASFL